MVPLYKEAAIAAGPSGPSILLMQDIQSLFFAFYLFYN